MTIETVRVFRSKIRFNDPTHNSRVDIDVADATTATIAFSTVVRSEPLERVKRVIEIPTHELFLLCMQTLKEIEDLDASVTAAAAEVAPIPAPVEPAPARAEPAPATLPPPGPTGPSTPAPEAPAATGPAGGAAPLSPLMSRALQKLATAPDTGVLPAHLAMALKAELRGVATILRSLCARGLVVANENRLVRLTDEGRRVAATLSKPAATKSAPKGVKMSTPESDREPETEGDEDEGVNSEPSRGRSVDDDGDEDEEDDDATSSESNDDAEEDDDAAPRYRTMTATNRVIGEYVNLAEANEAMRRSKTVTHVVRISDGAKVSIKPRGR